MSNISTTFLGIQMILSIYDFYISTLLEKMHDIYAHFSLNEL